MLPFVYSSMDTPVITGFVNIERNKENNILK
jgi:hypothetical protein